MKYITTIIITTILITSIVCVPFCYKKAAAQERTPTQTPVTVYRTEDESGFSQIVLNDNGDVRIITNDRWPHADPISDGKVVVWSAQVGSLWQLFYYDIASGQTIQLTRTGNNVDPHLSDGVVAWEGQRGGTWQILMFDGVRVMQITNSIYPAQDLVIKDGMIAYTQKNAQDEWQVYVFDILEAKINNLTPQGSGKDPIIEEGEVSWQQTDEDSGEITFFSYDTTSRDTFFEKVKEGRQKVGGTVLRRFKAIPDEPKEPVERTVLPKQVTIEDIKEELGLDFEGLAPESQAEETPVDEQPLEEVQESTESVTGEADVPESTTSGQ